MMVRCDIGAPALVPPDISSAAALVESAKVPEMLTLWPCIVVRRCPSHELQKWISAISFFVSYHNVHAPQCSRASFHGLRHSALPTVHTQRRDLHHQSMIGGHAVIRVNVPYLEHCSTMYTDLISCQKQR